MESRRSPQRHRCTETEPDRISQCAICLLCVLCVSVVHSSSLHDAAFHQFLRALHGVRRGALAEVVGDDPQAQRVRVARVLPHAADECVVAPLGVDRLRELPPFVSSMNTTPGAFASAAFASATDSGRVELDGDRFASAPPSPARARTSGRRRCVASPMIFFVSLITLFSSSVNPFGSRVQSSVMTLPASCARCAVGAGTGWPAAHALSLRLEVDQPLRALAGRRLVGGDHDALHLREIVQRLQRDAQRNRDAVRVRDDPLLDVVKLLRVHLGHDERAVRVHAPRGRVIDDDRAGLRGDRRELLADRTRRAAEDDLHARERLGAEQFDRVRFPR